MRPVVEFSQHSPNGRLASVVKTIWRARGTRAEFSAPEPIVPDGCVEIVFNLGDPFVGEDGERQPRALLAGQMTRPVVALPTGDVDLLGVRFFTATAGSALRLRMSQVQDRLLDASTIVADVAPMIDDLHGMRDDRRLAYLEATLRLHTERRSPNVVDHALALIDAHRGNIHIERVARAVGITRRHLERRFKEQVGLGVKQLARVTRVHAALRLMERQPMFSGAEISAHCGYSDQAHLIRECKALTGRTPAALMTTERSLAGMMRGVAAVRSA